jgi:hypothetical protein
VVIPTYLPSVVDPVPEVRANEMGVVLDYWHVLAEETTTHFSGSSIAPNSEKNQQSTIGAFDVAEAEREVTSLWAQIEFVWKYKEVAFRVSYNKHEWVPKTQAEFKYATIDDRMRKEARKIAESMIEQLKN